jgi:hypothetical protein
LRDELPVNNRLRCSCSGWACGCSRGLLIAIWLSAALMPTKIRKRSSEAARTSRAPTSVKNSKGTPLDPEVFANLLHSDSRLSATAYVGKCARSCRLEVIGKAES